MDLAQFGIMGVSLSKVLLGTENSHVGFLNVGSELGKGPYNIREACSIFKEMMPNISAGFIEGGDVVNGEADVVVADGFTGNCILKFGEGAMKFLKNRFKLAFNESLLLKIFSFFMKNKLRKVFVDPNAYNGAIFAGINGCVIKSHGASDVAAFISAIKSGLKIASKKEEFFKLMEADLNHFQGLDKD
jgi:glycerol-3-phosphate acyltransferase PlsX